MFLLRRTNILLLILLPYSLLFYLFYYELLDIFFAGFPINFLHQTFYIYSTTYSLSEDSLPFSMTPFLLFSPSLLLIPNYFSSALCKFYCIYSYSKFTPSIGKPFCCKDNKFLNLKSREIFVF